MPPLSLVLLRSVPASARLSLLVVVLDRVARLVVVVASAGATSPAIVVGGQPVAACAGASRSRPVAVGGVAGRHRPFGAPVAARVAAAGRERLGRGR